MKRFSTASACPANRLVPLDYIDADSGTPSYKSVPVRVVRSAVTDQTTGSNDAASADGATPPAADALRAQYAEPFGWWGYHWTLPTPMSAVEIVASGSMDARLMAALWAVVARRRGVMLASEAPQAGKTTTLSALVDFLPVETVGVFLRGWAQDTSWTDEIGPERGYLLVNEMSDHLPIYVWGRAALGALRLAGQGWGLGATMHADSLPEALATLRSLRATDADLAGLTIYLQYAAYATPAGMYRRVEEAWHLRLDDAGGGAGIDRRHRDDRHVDIGIFAHRQPVVGDDADQRHHQAHHRGEDGAPDADLGQAHRRPPGLSPSPRRRRPPRGRRRAVGSGRR